MIGKTRTVTRPAAMKPADVAASIRPRSCPIAVAATMNGSDVACKQAGGDHLAALQLAAVEQRREPAREQQGGDEGRDRGDRRGRREQRVEVEPDPAGDEEDGDEDAEADRRELAPKLGVGHRLVHVEVVEDRAGGERAEDQLEPELLGERDHPDQQDERRRAPGSARSCPAAAPARPRRGASAPPGGRRSRPRRSRRRTAPIRISFAPIPVDSPENSRVSRSTEAKSAIDAAAMTSWPNRERRLARVLEHRDDHAERGRGEDDRDQQRLVGDPGEVEHQARRPPRARGRPRTRAPPRATAAPAARRGRSRARRGTAGRRARPGRAPRRARPPRPSRARRGR